MAAGPNIHKVTCVTDQLPLQRVRVRFTGLPPAGRLERASGVSQVEIQGSTVRCLVHGSFQPFLEALRGYEVISLESTTAQSTKED